MGVHPWEISFMEPRVRQEIYGADPDTWVASPDAPFERATPVDGGYLFSDEWPYSTGTDYCDWVILGGMVTAAGPETSPVPDVRMQDVFVPDYRVYEAPKVIEGVYAAKWRLRHMLNELFERTSAGHPITPTERLRFRRNQVRATDRVFDTYAPLARMAGSAGIQEATGLERWWRDLQTAITS